MLYDSLTYTEQIRQISDNLNTNNKITDIYYSDLLKNNKLTPVKSILLILPKSKIFQFSNQIYI